jgi:hypothetical protein
VVENHRLDEVFYFTDVEGIYSLHLFDRLREASMAPDASTSCMDGWAKPGG